MGALIFWMLVGHAVADYPLQGDFLARAKNRAAPIPGVPWIHGLLPHAVMHAGAVALVTGSVSLGTAEFVVHCLIDDAKCMGRLTPAWWRGNGFFSGDPDAHAARTSFHIDQALHVACKVLWAVLATVGVA